MLLPYRGYTPPTSHRLAAITRIGFRFNPRTARPATKGEKVKTAQQAAQNWRESQGRAATAWTEGVQGYNGDWSGATVAQESVALQNITQAFTSGRWRAGVLAVGTGGWKAATVAKAPNYSQGFAAGASAQQTSIQKIMSSLTGIVPNLPPRGTYEQNKIRATTLMDALHAQRGQLGAR